MGCRASSTEPLGRCASPQAHEREEMQVLFAGVDWAEDHHDVCVMAEDGFGSGQTPGARLCLGNR
jgi:hypothetical protein